jgi:hypothetical protein
MLVELEVVAAVPSALVVAVAQLLADTINASNAAIIPKPRIFVFRKLHLLKLIINCTL